MRNCCEEFNDLSCVGMCDSITTGLTAASTGTYKISLVPGGGYVELDFTAGDSIDFDNVFNENGVTMFTVQNPSGTLLSLNGKECFKVLIKTALSLV